MTCADPDWVSPHDARGVPGSVKTHCCPGLFDNRPDMFKANTVTTAAAVNVPTNAAAVRFLNVFFF